MGFSGNANRRNSPQELALQQQYQHQQYFQGGAAQPSPFFGQEFENSFDANLLPPGNFGTNDQASGGRTPQFRGNNQQNFAPHTSALPPLPQRQSQGKEARFALGSLQQNIMSGRGSTGRSRRKPAPPAHPTDDDDSTNSPSKASLRLLLEAKTNENKGLRKENKRLTKSLEDMTEECDIKQGQIDELHSKMGVTKKTVGSDLDKKVRLVAFIFVCIGYLGGTPLNLCVSLLKDQAYGGQYRVH